MPTHTISTDKGIKERKIAVLLSVYNEEKHIENTLRKILLSNNTSPIDKIYIGDDGSLDNTTSIIEALQIEFPQIVLEKYNRLGKPNVIRSLVEKYQLNNMGYHLVMMDANISCETDTLNFLVEKLNQIEVGIVGASVYSSNDIANLESEYILRENKIKSEESRVTGYTVGMFGACFAMKGELYHPIPTAYITDDLFHTFSVIEQKKKALYLPEAKVYEHITTDISNEFRRKKRYAAGNFQILIHFWRLLLPYFSSWGFVYCYFFHKIIRWIAPVLLFMLWAISWVTSNYWMSLGGTIILLFMFVNYQRQKKGQKPFGYRLYYFLAMNWAILLGFFNYIKGIKTNVWERSERF